MSAWIAAGALGLAFLVSMPDCLRIRREHHPKFRDTIEKADRDDRT